jgi:hypothetical protein
VHRSSESFATLAAALAKAQAKLVNPEKSLTGTIRSGRLGEADRTFRYAPLSSGLEIVRKTLSEHEIAVIQTTAVDQPSRMLNLTTLLAHSSGEWIASCWPVCPIAEIAHPHRMGAALTYARRYALFTLVGIAGEDDLDAPDICMPSPLPSASSAGTGWSTDGSPFPRQSPGNGKVHAVSKTASPTILGAEDSAALRDRLLSEIAGFASQDSATAWAREALAAKNTLTAADAQALEGAFEQKLAAFASAQAATSVVSSEAPPVPAPVSQEAAPSKGADQPQPAAGDKPASIDKSVLMISAPRRYRSKEHLRYVIAQPCLFCTRKPSDAHHLRFMQPRALGRKTSDEFAVPLCRTHHRAAHRAADEQAWWKAIGIDPVKVARKLWRDSRATKGQQRVISQTEATQTAPLQNTRGDESKAP